MMAFKQSGVTMVLVSHMMEDILNMCDRAAWIDDHRIKKQGNAREVVESYLQAQ
jgi:lipopolysaccharide transport system ATP-binding protein